MESLTNLLSFHTLYNILSWVIDNIDSTATNFHHLPLLLRFHLPLPPLFDTFFHLLPTSFHFLSLSSTTFNFLSPPPTLPPTTSHFLSPPPTTFSIPFTYSHHILTGGLSVVFNIINMVSCL